LDVKHPDNDQFDLKAARQKHDRATGHGHSHSEPADDAVTV
jgi:hypothetical protein